MLPVIVVVLGHKSVVVVDLAVVLVSEVVVLIPEVVLVPDVVLSPVKGIIYKNIKNETKNISDIGIIAHDPLSVIG